MPKKDKIVEIRLKRRFSINIGVIIFLMIFIYVVANVIIYLRKDTLTIYRVPESKISEKFSGNAIAIREETLVESDYDGYVSYYVGAGEKVKSGGLVYSVDETGKVNEYVKEMVDQEDTLNQLEYSKMEDEIYQYKKEASDTKFGDIYLLKYDLENTASEIGSSILKENMDELQQKLGAKCFQKGYSQSSGIVTYIQDGYEYMTAKLITEKSFDLSKYEQIELKTEKKVKKGDYIYRIVKNNEWQIVLPLSTENYEKMKENKKFDLLIKKDGLTIPSQGINFMEKNGKTYLVISLTSYMIRYINDRFLDVEIQLNSEEGLKIPNTALVEKEYYKVPLKFKQDPNNTSSSKFLVNPSDGKSNKKTITLSIGMEDEDYCYIPTDEVKQGTILAVSDDNDTYLLEKKTKLNGVYCVNKGYASFKPVTIKKKNTEYCIVKNNMTGSIAAYDRIVLNSDTIEEDQLIY